MSIPFGDETVTLLKQVTTVNASTSRSTITYARKVLSGCSWRRSTRMTQNGNAEQYSENIICRIPPDQEQPSLGDALIRGLFSGTVSTGADLAKLVKAMRNNGGAFIVASVSDFTSSPMPHFKTEG